MTHLLDDTASPIVVELDSLRRNKVRSKVGRGGDPDNLSFIERRPRIGGFDYWAVTAASGNRSNDWYLGETLALEYLQFLGKYPTYGNYTLLGCIVGAMMEKTSGKLSGIELAFLQGVNQYAAAMAHALTYRKEAKE